MRISDGRANYLSKIIAEKMISGGLVVGATFETLAKEVRKGIIFFISRLEEVDQKARLKIASQKRGIPEGSPEYEVLYRQYYNEEISKG